MERDIKLQSIIDQQQTTPFAVVSGSTITAIPEDLYIPPDSLKIFLETFEGPLDFLLYLIRRQNLNIMELPIAKIAAQYAQYIEMMNSMQLELAAEYLLMSATLAEIKSRMLLPRPPEEEDEEDPRAELVRRLLEYQRFKKVAGDIDMLHRLERDLMAIEVMPPAIDTSKPLPDVDLKEVVIAFQEVLRRAELRRGHRIEREPLSVRERMTIILALITDNESVPFIDCFLISEGRGGVIVSLLALLELLRSSMIEAIQAAPYSTIYIRAV